MADIRKLIEKKKQEKEALIEHEEQKKDEENTNNAWKELGFAGGKLVQIKESYDDAAGAKEKLICDDTSTEVDYFYKVNGIQKGFAGQIAVVTIGTYEDLDYNDEQSVMRSTILKDVRDGRTIYVMNRGAEFLKEVNLPNVERGSVVKMKGGDSKDKTGLITKIHYDYSDANESTFELQYGTKQSEVAKCRLSDAVPHYVDEFKQIDLGEKGASLFVDAGTYVKDHGKETCFIRDEKVEDLLTKIAEENKASKRRRRLYEAETGKYM